MRAERENNRRQRLINETRERFREVYGSPLDDSDARELIHSLAHYCQTLLEIEAQIESKGKHD